MAAEDLEFRIRADNSEAIGPIEEVGAASTLAALKIEAANLKVEKATAAVARAVERYGADSLQAREAQNRLGQASARLARSLETVDDAAEEASEGVDGFGVALAGVGAIATAGLAAGIVKAMDIEAGTDKLQAQLGATAEEAERYGETAGEVYAGAFGESMEDVNDAIKNVTQNIGQLGDEGDSSLQNTTQNVLSLSEAFGVDLFGSTKAVGTLIRTGLAKDANEALDLITRGLQKIPGAEEDLIDTLTEYAVQFQALGLTGPQALAFINSAMQGGARNTDLAADALKEFNLRARDLGNTDAQGALEKLGLNAEETARKIAGGGSSASAALVDILTRLRAVPDAADRSTLATALLGTQAEDLQEALFAVDPAQFAAGLGEIDGAANELSATLGDNGKAKVEAYSRQLEMLAANAAGVSGPVGAAAAVTVAFGGAALSGAGATAQIVTAITAMGGVGGIITATSARMSALGVTTARARAAALGLGTAVAVVGTAAAAVEIGEFVGEMQVAEPATQKLSMALEGLADNGDLGQAGLELFAKGMGPFRKEAESTGQALERFGTDAFNALDQGWDARLGRWQSFGSAQSEFRKETEQLDKSFAAMAANGNLDQATESFDMFVKAGTEAGVPLAVLEKQFPKYQAAVASAGKEAGLAAAFSNDLAAGNDKVAASAQVATVSLDELTAETSEYAGVALDGRDAARGYESAIDGAAAAAKGSKKTLDISTEAGRTNAEALDGIASSGLKLAQTLVDGGGTQKQFRDQLVRTRSDLIKAGERFGLTRGQARRYADSILKIPSKATTRVSAPGVQSSRESVNRLIGKIYEINGKTYTYTIQERIVSDDRRDAAMANRGRRATGGPVYAGQSYLVGENGPELFRPLNQGVIDSTATTMGANYGATGGGGGVATVVLSVESGGTDMERMFVEMIRQHVRIKGQGDVQTALGRN